MLPTPTLSQPDANSLPPPPAPPPAPKITRGHSCILCQQRKVRCDRGKPACGNCVKARAECVPSAPTQPRRRRRKLTEIDLVGRLRRYESLLKSHGIKTDDDSPSEEAEENQVPRLSMTVPRARHHERGALFTNKENSHYVENTLWENLRDEIQDPKDALQGSSEDEMNQDSNPLYPPAENFLVGFPTATKDLSSLHPPPVQIFRLWQTFLVNVNPLVGLMIRRLETCREQKIKMFHAPTIQQTILDASGDLDHVPRHVEALMFAIYFLAVTSLGNEDCEAMFGEPRSTLVAKYSHATQQALINSKFLKSLNILTLQSLLVFLLGVRKCYDPHSLWVLSGVTVRIAQRLGLHRDGSSLKIPPFDAEIRRRTWWQIVFLDGNASKMAGAGFPAWLAKFDTRIPMNVSDSDLSPTMKELPTEKEGATEMLVCCLRYETAQAIRSAKSMHYGFGHRTSGGGGGAAASEGGNWAVKTGAELIPEKDKAIDELEARFEQRFLRYCDASIPLHLLATLMAKSVICTMRIMAHHPRQYADKGATMPQKEKDMVFAECLKELEYDTLGHTTPAVRGFRWHTTSHFQLDAFIYLLSELRHRTTGEIVERAWQQIQLSYDHRPEMIHDRKNTLYTAMGNLALKAWAKREDALGTYQAPPRFISLLRSQRNIPDPPRPVAEISRADILSRPSQTMNFNSNVPPDVTYNNFEMSDQQWGSASWGNWEAMPEITPVDWEYWQHVMDGELPGFPGDGGGGHLANEAAGQSWFP